MTRITEAFKRGDRLTHLSCLDKYGTYRLSSYVNRLRANGMKIEGRYVNGRNYKTYWLDLLPTTNEVGQFELGLKIDDKYCR